MPCLCAQSAGSSSETAGHWDANRHQVNGAGVQVVLQGAQLHGAGRKGSHDRSWLWMPCEEGKGVRKIPWGATSAALLRKGQGALEDVRRTHGFSNGSPNKEISGVCVTNSAVLCPTAQGSASLLPALASWSATGPLPGPSRSACSPAGCAACPAGAAAGSAAATAPSACCSTCTCSASSSACSCWRSCRSRRRPSPSCCKAPCCSSCTGRAGRLAPSNLAVEVK